MRLAPVAVFVHRRPDHTRRLLESLSTNEELGRTPVFVFADGPRSATDAEKVRATREVVRAAAFPNLTLVERAENAGLARSITEGVTRLCAEYGRVIVLEDDLVVSSSFLEYMNAALERYRDEENVFSVSGFMYDVDAGVDTDALMLPFISSWGWATWARAWRHYDPRATAYGALQRDRRMRRRFDLDGNYPYYEMLQDAMAGRNDSWAIRWYLSVFARNGQSVFPRRSLVENRGFDAEGTHCVGEGQRHVRTRAHVFHVRTFPAPGVVPSAYRRVRRFLGRDFPLHSRARKALGATRLGTVIRRLLRRA